MRYFMGAAYCGRVCDDPGTYPFLFVMPDDATEEMVDVAAKQIAETSADATWNEMSRYAFKKLVRGNRVPVRIRSTKGLK